jgi:hypothetical protein
VWIGGHHFRVRQGASEIGGTLGAQQGLSVSGAYLVPAMFRAPYSESDLNPTAFIRKQLAAGQARLAGRSTIGGRKVIEIDTTSRLFGDTVATARYFVDARTYEPVRLIVTAAVPNAAPGVLPLGSVVSFPYGGYTDKGEYVYRYDFTRFERLPASDSKLANIRAEHPGAKII